METLYEHFKNHVQPKLNPLFTHYMFDNESQDTSMFDQFLVRLKLLRTVHMVTLTK